MDMPVGTMLLLAFALAIALGFEVINGFHDTANAVATVIYTKSLKAQVAVVWSGIMNFLGVLLGGIAVAFSIVHLLPVDLLVKIDSGAGVAMVIALLLAAIIWNFGTWYLAIPSSSSHTLIGAIIGVGLANSLLAGQFGSGVNWPKATEVGLSLLLSPMIGFGLAGLLLLLVKWLVPNPELHRSPQGPETPPWWIRSVLIVTCTGVSFAHGSNDGQKGIGLIMLILIGLVPASYALDMAQSPEEFCKIAQAAKTLHEVVSDPTLEKKLAVQPFPPTPGLQASTQAQTISVNADAPSSAAPADDLDNPTLAGVQQLLASLLNDLHGKEKPADFTAEDRWQVRTKIVMIEHALTQLRPRMLAELTAEKAGILNQARARLRGAIEYAPGWVMLAVALALGLGTMVGWKRIVITIGEKIGKRHLTYSQGAAAELVAMSTIGLADVLGMPVSTTQVLSSGVAGTMAANKTGLQSGTIKTILLAWILTLPVSMILSAGIFLLFRIFV